MNFAPKFMVNILDIKYKMCERVYVFFQNNRD